MVAHLEMILRSMRIAKDVKISHDHPKEDLPTVRSRDIVARGRPHFLELTIQHTKLKEGASMCHQLKGGPLLEFTTEGDPHLEFILQI